MSEEMTHEILEIPIAEIWNDDDFNCRGEILSTPTISELANHIREHGLIQPVVVMPMPQRMRGEHPQYKYRLIAGFRRTLAYKALKRDKILAVIRKDITNELEALSLNLSENLHRKNLDIMQEARALQKMQKYGMTRSDYARMTGKSEGWVQIRLMLIQMPAEIQAPVAKGEVTLTQSQIRNLYTLLEQVGVDATLKGFAKIRDAQLKNNVRPPSLKSKEQQLKSKAIRGKIEQENMQDYIYELHNQKSSYAAQILAWTLGNISTGDFLEATKKYCEQQGIEYTAPTFLDEM